MEIKKTATAWNIVPGKKGTSIEVPDTEGVNVYHACNNSLSNGGKRGFGHVINGLGKSTYDTFRDNRVVVDDYRKAKTK